MGRHTSEMERRAAEAEREILQWKKVRFMADKVGDAFDGYITGVAPFGMFVELIEHYVEGLVHVTTMADDYYRYRETQHALFGENSKKLYRLGDRVRVQIIKVDMERRQIELGPRGRAGEAAARTNAAAARSAVRRGPKKEQRKGTPEERRRRKKQRPGKLERKAKKRR